MNYQRIHDEIILRAISRAKPIPSEMHHILPKCMGGDNSSDNLVALTPREHVIIHVLLYKIHRTGQMAYAVTAMRMSTRFQSRPNSRQISEARVKASEYYSENYSGVNHNWYGRKHTEETKIKQRNSAMGRTKDPVGVEKTARSKRKKVIATCIHTGVDKELEGMRKAVELGYAKNHGSVSSACRGKIKTHNGYSWRYAGQS